MIPAGEQEKLIRCTCSPDPVVLMKSNGGYLAECVVCHRTTWTTTLEETIKEWNTLHGRKDEKK